jgi:hypothetical protein
MVWRRPKCGRRSTRPGPLRAYDERKLGASGPFGRVPGGRPWNLGPGPQWRIDVTGRRRPAARASLPSSLLRRAETTSDALLCCASGSAWASCRRSHGERLRTRSPSPAARRAGPAAERYVDASANRGIELRHSTAGPETRDDQAVLAGAGMGNRRERALCELKVPSGPTSPVATKVGPAGPCGPCGPCWACRTRRSLRPLGPSRPLRPSGPLRAGVALVALRPLRPRLAPRDRRLARTTALGRRINQPQLAVL